MIRLAGIGRDYQLGKRWVRGLVDVSLQVAEGDFLAVSGPSGSGKSTLLNILGCLDRPTRGTMEIFGRDVARLGDTAKAGLRARHIGFIFQSFNLVPVLSAYENVEYPLLLIGAAPHERRRRVGSLLEKVGLGGFARHWPDTLSGGQRQRVAIARALVAGPRLVLADEPTANLDTRTSFEILDLMAGLNRESGTTFVFSTHDPRVTRYATRTLLLEDGAIAA
jgi:putative ABC transport system ATP-binding protein